MASAIAQWGGMGQPAVPARASMVLAILLALEMRHAPAITAGTTPSVTRANPASTVPPAPPAKVAGPTDIVVTRCPVMEPVRAIRAGCLMDLGNAIPVSTAIGVPVAPPVPIAAPMATAARGWWVTLAVMARASAIPDLYPISPRVTATLAYQEITAAHAPSARVAVAMETAAKE